MSEGWEEYRRLFDQMSKEWPELRNDVTDLKVQMAAVEGRAVGKAKAWAAMIALLSLGLTAFAILIN